MACPQSYATTCGRYSGTGCKSEDSNTPARRFPGSIFIRPCGLGAARLPLGGSWADRMSDFETGENMND
jgi:hypothetical protein